MTRAEQKIIIDIANNLAEIRDWAVIPEETEAGINNILDRLNNIVL